MKNHNPNNERIKRKYLVFLKEAKRQSELSIDAAAQAISRFEVYVKYRDFKAFHFEQAVGFKKYLAKQNNPQTDKPLSKATLNSTLRHLKIFFQWLAMQQGYKSRINFTDIEYFNLSEKDTAVAMANHGKPTPTLEQIMHVIKLMPNNMPVDKRDRSLIAFTILTGVRDSAIASLKLKHINLENNSIFQDAREVKTKFSKTFTTFFFPVGGGLQQIICDWVNYLKNELLFSGDDPLFPKTKIMCDGKTKKFQYTSLTKEHWQTTTPIRAIFSKAFHAAGLPYFNPHSFRKTLANLGEKICQTPESFKAWSQNLGHEEVLTTFYSYGEVQIHRQAEIFRQFHTPSTPTIPSVDEFAKAVAREMRNQGAG
jgi:integrase/recombinase XerD